MKADDVAVRLRDALRSELPGPEAQTLMSPRPRTGWEPGVYPPGTRQAGGLILVYPMNELAHVVLTQRRADLPDHGGQVSLPGGELEGNETVEQAALRETLEEVSIDPAGVEVLGRLTALHIPVSNFVLHPVVGVAAERPEMSPADREVARILETPIATLADPDAVGLERREHLVPPPEVPFFRVSDLRVWGATAMVLAEFLALLDVAPDPWEPRPEATHVG